MFKAFPSWREAVAYILNIKSISVQCAYHGIQRLAPDYTSVDYEFDFSASHVFDLTAEQHYLPPCARGSSLSLFHYYDIQETANYRFRRVISLDVYACKIGTEGAETYGVSWYLIFEWEREELLDGIWYSTYGWDAYVANHEVSYVPICEVNAFDSSGTLVYQRPRRWAEGLSISGSCSVETTMLSAANFETEAQTRSRLSLT